MKLNMKFFNLFRTIYVKGSCSFFSFPPLFFICDSLFLFLYIFFRGREIYTGEVSSVLAGSPFHLQGGSHLVPQKTGTYATWVTFAPQIAENEDGSASSLK